MVKHVSHVNGLCLETKQTRLKSCVARNGDPCLKQRSFSQLQIVFQQFCFHEIRSHTVVHPYRTRKIGIFMVIREINPKCDLAITDMRKWHCSFHAVVHL